MQGGSVLRTPPPAWGLSSFQDFFQNLRNSELQKLRILRFLISEILNFYNSWAALGIEAASFVSEVITKQAKIERKARRRSRTPKEGN